MSKQFGDLMAGAAGRRFATSADMNQFLNDAGLRIDLCRLNVVLRPHGLRVRSEAVPGSEGQVQIILNADTTEPRALFWVESLPKGAADDEPLIDGIPAKYVVRP